MASARIAKPQAGPSASSSKRTASSKVATHGTASEGHAGGGRAAASKAKTKMAQNARFEDEDDEAADENDDLPSSSSAEIKKMAEKIKAKQVRAAQAKRTAFQNQSKARIEAFGNAADTAVAAAKKRSALVARYAAEICSLDGKDRNPKARKDLLLDVSNETNIIDAMILAFQADTDHIQDIKSTASYLAFDRSNLRRQGREHVSDAKSLCKRRLQEIQDKQGAEEFLKRYAELMTTALVDPSLGT